MTRLQEYRRRYGLTQEDVIEAVRQRARERGDRVEPGLNQPTLSRHENGHTRPTPYYQALYCKIYGATPADLGFRLPLPGENGHHEDVDRREFLTGAAGFAASVALPTMPATPRRLGNADVVRLRQSVAHLVDMANRHGGAGAVYAVTARTFKRVRSLVEHASYDRAMGTELRELAGEIARHAGFLAFDAGQHDEARGWWLEAMHWARLAEADLVGGVSITGVGAMAAMARHASDQHQPRQAIDLAATAQRTAARAAVPRLMSLLAAREALGHAGCGDGRSAHAALRRARGHVGTRRDDDPGWLDFYGPADFASHEYRVALMLGDFAAAEDAARSAHALDEADRVAYARNYALGLIDLADALVQRRKIDEGAAVVKQATIAAADLDSARVTRGLRAVTERLTH